MKTFRRPSSVMRFFRRSRRRASSIMCAGLLTAVCMIALLPGAATAQAACGEGRTSAGQCVDAALAGARRQIAIIFSQPKISATAYPVMPSSDSRVRYPHQLNSDPSKPSSIGTLAPN